MYIHRILESDLRHWLDAGWVDTGTRDQLASVAEPIVLVEWPGDGPPPGMDTVNSPTHYTSHPSGVECIRVVEHMTFCVGNAIKYLWRSGLKGDRVEDLKKARWYIDREIERLGTRK